MAPIPAGSTVLVTGSNGYLASHIVDQLLSSGYHVRGTVRSLDRGSWLLSYFSDKCGPDRLTLHVVPDMSIPDAFTDAMQGCAGVVHVASNLSFSPVAADVIPGVEKTVQYLLASVTKTPSVKRFVLTSSSSAAVFPVPDKRFKVFADSWNDFSVEQAWKEGEVEGKGYHVYCASKVAAEKAMWKFVEENKDCAVECNAVLPYFVMGKVLGRKYGQNGSTGGAVVNVYAETGEKQAAAMNMLKMVPPQWMVNAADAAKLHVAALNDPTIVNERIFAFGETYNNNEILQLMRVLRPHHQIPPKLDDDSHDFSDVVPRARAEEILIKHFERGFVGLGETLEEALEAVDEGM